MIKTKKCPSQFLIIDRIKNKVKNRKKSLPSITSDFYNVVGVSLGKTVLNDSR